MEWEVMEKLVRQLRNCFDSMCRNRHPLYHNNPIESSTFHWSRGFLVRKHQIERDKKMAEEEVVVAVHWCLNC
jgi:hypothetical protein